MKKWLFFLVAVLILFLSQFAFAGGDSRLGAAFELGIPLGDFENVAGTGFGGTAQYDYSFSPKVALTLQAGYISWGEVNVSGSDANVSAAASVKFGSLFFNTGVKYFLNEGGGRFYLAGLIGIYRMEVDSEASIDIGGLPIQFSISSSESKFAASPGIGAEIDLSNKFTLDLTARYQWVDGDFSHLNFRGGVLYNF